MTTATTDTEKIQGTSARTINLCIGSIALLLGPGLVLIGQMSRFFLPTHTGWPTAPSISHYYYFNDLTHNCFVGALVAIGFLMLSYRGWSRHNHWDRAVAFLSGISAWVVGLVPCCSSISWLHFSGAVTLFGLMAAMLRYRFTEHTGDVDEKAYPAWKDLRNRVYRVCSNMILIAMAIKAISLIFPDQSDIRHPGNLTFWIEVIGLISFSIGWLTKSRFVLGYGKKDGYLHRTAARESKFAKPIKATSQDKA